jgi:hypothetical protein
MKVLAVKDVVEYSNAWAVRYTRLRKGVKQEAMFLCDTPEEAKAKYDESLDIVEHHDGVYLGKKAKKQLKTRRRNLGS